MSQITVRLDPRHAAAMPLPLDDIRQRITDIEERAMVRHLSSSAIVLHVHRRCNIAMARALGIIPRDA